MRRLAILAMVVALLGAGCLGSEVDAAPVETTPTPTTAGVVSQNQTDAPDGRGDLAAFKETNATVTNGTDAMDHKHDYWGGAERKIIASFDSGLIPIPIIPEGKAPGTAIADYDLPEPNLVYEGTKHLEVVFTDVQIWGTGLAGDLEHPAITVYVDYLTAADEPGNFRPAGQATPGEPLVIPVKPTEADMPHQTKSLWVFRIYTGEANAFTYNVTITAVKGYDVVDWPPHPDLYRDSPTRVIFDGDVTGKYDGWHAGFLYGSDSNWVYPERIISYGTDRVEVVITRGAWKGITPEPEPARFELQFTNASYIPKVGNGDPAGGHLKDETSDGTTYRFDVPVDQQGYDTPYGTASRWGFRFVPLIQGSPPWEHDYHMLIIAHGHSIEQVGDGPQDRPA